MESRRKTSPDNTPLFFKLNLADRNWFYFKRALSLAIGIRIAILIISYFVGREVLGRSVSIYELMHETLCRWDTLHFINIAEHGYSYTKDADYLLAFFFLFPFLIAIVTLVFRDFFISGLFVSFAASVAAGYFLQKLVSLDEGDHDDSGRALWYFYLFPTSYFLVVPYSESVFLAFSIASFYFARRSQWLTSGLLAAFASATRINGIVLLPALLAEVYLRECNVQNRNFPSKETYWVFLTPLGLLANLLNCWHVSGNPLAYMEIEKKHFYASAVLPWNNISHLIEQYINSPASPYRTMNSESILAAVFLTIFLLLAGWQWLRISYQIYAWAQIALILSASWVISYPRYLLAIFPVFISLAKVGRNEEGHNVLSVATAVCMGGLFAIFASGRFTF